MTATFPHPLPPAAESGSAALACPPLSPMPPSCRFVPFDRSLALSGFFFTAGEPNPPATSPPPPVNVPRQPHAIPPPTLPSGSLREGVARQDRYLAFQSLWWTSSRYGRQLEPTVQFTTAQLLAELDLADSGRHYQSIRRWLSAMASTCRESGHSQTSGPPVDAVPCAPPFAEVGPAGTSRADSVRNRGHQVTVAPWVLANLVHRRIVFVDFLRYQRLRSTTARGLVPLLQIWLYASRAAGVFQKRYEAVCRLLALRPCRHRSQIVQRLGPALEELTQAGWLHAWSIEPTRDRTGVKVVLRPPRVHTQRPDDGYRSHLMLNGGAAARESAHGTSSAWAKPKADATTLLQSSLQLPAPTTAQSPVASSGAKARSTYTELRTAYEAHCHEVALRHLDALTPAHSAQLVAEAEADLLGRFPNAHHWPSEERRRTARRLAGQSLTRVLPVPSFREFVALRGVDLDDLLAQLTR